MQQAESFEQREGIFAAGDANRDAVAFADHVEAFYGFAGFLEECSFGMHLFECSRKKAAIPFEGIAAGVAA